MLPPKVHDAPGITWRLLKHGWECRWRANPDAIRRGWKPLNVRLFAPAPGMSEPSEIAKEWIAERATLLQNEMNIWSNGGIETQPVFDGETWASLIDCYRTDRDSPYASKRYKTRLHYDALCRRIKKDCGFELIAETDARRFRRLHDQWSAGGKVSMGHSLIGMVRTLVSFGRTYLKCPHCKELRSDLHEMRFKTAKPREERLTAEMVEAIRSMAPAMGYRSLGLAQAFQFDLMLRQKDVIGEWVPVSEPGISDVIDRNQKWLRGIRWEEIDDNLRLTHTTSKRQKEIDPDLTLAPMVMEELRFIAQVGPNEILRRDMLPASGPIVTRKNGLPWVHDEFRRLWRKVATAAGIPTNVRNMDSRAGAISEATDAGAELEHVRHAATHSDIAMTQRYSRGSQDKVAKVMKLRAEHRVNRGKV